MSRQYKMLKLLSRLVCLFPYPLLLVLGRILGHLYYYIAGRQRRRAHETIKRSLNVTDIEADKTAQSMFVKLGQTFLEVMYMPKLTATNIHRYVEFENRHFLEEAVSAGRGVVLLTAHMSNWEWLGAALALTGFPITSVIKRQPNDQHTRILNEYREMVGIEIFARGTSELVGAAKALKKGKILGFLADQDAGKNGVFIEFLGKMASTPLGPAVFAKKFKSPVVPVFIVRNPEGGLKIIMQAPLYYQDTGDQQQDLYQLTVSMTKIIENMIKTYPDNWLWFQKRWNTVYDESKAGGLGE